MATWTAADVAALKVQIARGTLSVSFADRSVTYNSLKEMRDLLAEMERSVAGTPSYRVAATDKRV